MKKENYLIICSQNVGRSQMGKGYLQTFAADNPAVRIMSAGVDIRGMRRKCHNRPHPQVVAVMHEDNIDISQHKITQLKKRHMRKAVKIIALCAKEELPQYVSKFLNKVIVATIADPAPVGQNIPILELERLRQIRDQIKQIMFGIYEGGEVYA